MYNGRSVPRSRGGVASESYNLMDKPPKPKVAIIGLGYVGLPLCLRFARSEVQVLGIDIDPDKVDVLNNGRSYIKHVPTETVAEQVKARGLAATTVDKRDAATAAKVPSGTIWKA
jgi:UDP-N-acetyl-D-mannosaminuronate dehydrogenase